MKTKGYIFHLSDEDRNRLEIIKENMEAVSLTEAIRILIRKEAKRLEEEKIKGELLNN